VTDAQLRAHAQAALAPTRRTLISLGRIGIAPSELAPLLDTYEQLRELYSADVARTSKRASVAHLAQATDADERRAGADARLLGLARCAPSSGSALSS
jgi:hypothetical protein